MNKISIIALVVAVIALGLNFVHFGDKATLLGGTTNFDAITLDNGNLTLTNGSISIATPTTGTSTVATVGCLQANATSSATKIKVVFVASSTQMAPGYNGLAYWVYGTCP